MVKKKTGMKEIKIDLSKVKLCPECASDNIFYSEMRDELICRDCGGIFSKLTPEQMEKYKDRLI
jgi:ribosomal protein S27E